MTDLTKIFKKMNANPKGVRFVELKMICVYYFGDSRVNIQNDKGKAKAYQIRQVFQAIQKLTVNNDL